MNQESLARHSRPTAPSPYHRLSLVQQNVTHDPVLLDLLLPEVQVLLDSSVSVQLVVLLQDVELGFLRKEPSDVSD